MGPYRAAALSLLFCTPVLAQAPGWSFSPLSGEGDRAAMGCDRESTKDNFICIVVRCEDDFFSGIHLFSSRKPDALGTWALTLDREDRSVDVVADAAPYSGRVATDTEWLLDRLQQGSYIYLRHSADETAAFRFITLAGSFAAIHEALYWCAPRVTPTEQNAETGVESNNELGEKP